LVLDSSAHQGSGWNCKKRPLQRTPANNYMQWLATDKNDPAVKIYKERPTTHERTSPSRVLLTPLYFKIALKLLN
jgi:hypothetical protein